MGSNLRRCENETAILLLALSQLANRICSSSVCVCVMQTQRVYERRVPEGQNTRRDNTKRAHLRLWKLKTDAAATTTTARTAQNISILNDFPCQKGFCAAARREKSCECKINPSRRALRVFKCPRDLSDGVCDG